jgi:hypothetical protein
LTAAGIPQTGRAYLRLREEVLEYLWRRFPHHCIVMTDPQTRAVVDLAARRAAVHGFHEQQEISSWVTLMIFFGAFFDEDPLWRWASVTLRETRGQNREAALEHLFAAMNASTRPVIGIKGHHYRDGLLWLRSLRFEAIAANFGGSVDDSIEHWLQTAFPTRHASLTRDQIGILISESRTRAQQFGLNPHSGSIIYALLIAFLGFGISQDPLHAWAGEALQNGGSSPDAKTAALHSVGIGMLRRYLVLNRFGREE